MTTSTLRPNATNYNQGTLTGTTLHGAWSDDSDSTYDTLDYTPEAASVECGTFTLPSGAVTKQVRERIRAKSTPGAGVGVRVTIDLKDLANPVTTHYALTTTATDYTGGYTSATLDQTQIDAIAMVVQCWPAAPEDTDSVIVYETFVDVVYVTQPSTSVTAVSPDPYTASTIVPIAWTNTLDSDGGAQTRFELKVFTDAQYGAGGFDPDTSTPYYTSGQVVSSSTTTNTGPLANSDTYRAYVRVAQTVNGTAHWSDWAYDQFTMSVTTSDVDTVTIYPNDATGSIDVVVARDTGTAAWEYIEVERCTTFAGSSTNNTADNFVSTPSVDDLNILNDFSIIMRLAPTDWTPVTWDQLIGKWGGNDPKRQYRLNITAAGELILAVYDEGVAAVVSVTSSTDVQTASGVANGDPLWIAASVDLDDGASDSVFRFWWSDADDGETWTQIGTDVNAGHTITMRVGNDPQPLVIAAEVDGTNYMAGTMYYAALYEGIGRHTAPGQGEKIAEWVGGTAPTYTDRFGHVWNITTTGYWNVNDPVTWEPVRFATVVEPDSANQHTVTDYETGNAQPVAYRARATYYSSGLPITSDWTYHTGSGQAYVGTDEWSSDDMWLKSPTDPTLNVKWRRRKTGHVSTRDRRAGVFDVVGAASRVVISDTRSGMSGTFQAVSYHAGETIAIHALLDGSPVVLVQWPADYGLDDLYCAITVDDVAAAVERAGEGHRFWSFSYVEVDSPDDDTAGSF